MTALIIGYTLVGFLIGHVIRRLIPRLLNLKDRSLPFAWPWLELTGGIMFAVTSWRFDAMAALPWLLFCSVTLAAIGTDYGFKLIPDEVQLVGIVLGVIASTWQPEPILSFLGHKQLIWSMLGSANPHVAGAALSISGAISGFVFLGLARWVLGRMAGMDVMGFGDVKFMALLGAFVGPEMAVVILFPSSIIGIVSGVTVRLIYGIPHAPFGPPLAFGAMVMAYFHNELVHSVSAFYGRLFSLPKSFNLIFFFVLIATLVWLLLRIKKRASMYSKMIERDYEEISQHIEEDS
ncbi:MAG: prepilin peptidase [Acidobacteria bacterium]|nr:prepilin peptidase [Acidobacteriota bacterium]